MYKSCILFTNVSFPTLPRYLINRTMYEKINVIERKICFVQAMSGNVFIIRKSHLDMIKKKLANVFM